MGMVRRRHRRRPVDRLRSLSSPRPPVERLVPVEDMVGGAAAPPGASPASSPEPLTSLPDGAGAAMVVEGLAGAVPGPGLAGRLAGLDPARLAGYDLIEDLAAWERLIGWATAGKLAALAELARRRPAPVELNRRTPAHGAPGDSGAFSPFAADEVAARLRIERGEAQSQLVTAVALTTRLPGTRAALAAGSIDLKRAQVLVDGTGALSEQHAAAVEAHCLHRAGRQTPRLLRRSVTRRAHRVDPAGAKTRAAAARAHREAWITPLDDQMATLGFYLPAVDAQTVWTGLDAASRARRARGDRRSLAELRCDTLTGWAKHALERCDAPLATRQGRRPHIQVTLAASTAMGLDDLPGHLAGYGPIDADTARAVAADGTWRRLLTDPVDGRVTDYGTTTYTPPQHLRDLVLARYPDCTMAHCGKQSATSELDHLHPYPHGPTSERNLHPPCTPHHKIRHQGGWHVARAPDGTIHWRTPTGHTYANDPDPPDEVDPPF